MGVLIAILIPVVLIGLFVFIGGGNNRGMASRDVDYEEGRTRMEQTNRGSGFGGGFGGPTP